MFFWNRKKCKSTARLDGKTAIVTGGNSGIGKLTVKDFYKRGCRTIMACRNLQKGEEAKKEIETELENTTGLGEIVIRHLDVTSSKSVREFVSTIMQEEEKINILVNNAGYIGDIGRTEDGFDLSMGTNYFGPFLLTLLLLPRIIKSAPARIVNVSSLMYFLGRIRLNDVTMTKSSYNNLDAYATSKLANIQFTRQLAARLKGTGVNVYATHPGFMTTPIVQNTRTFLRCVIWCVSWPFYKTVELGSQTQIHCSVCEEVASETGLFYGSCKSCYITPNGTNDDVACKLWKASTDLLGLDNFDPFATHDITKF